jgi:hypothetical protein
MLLAGSVQCGGNGTDDPVFCKFAPQVANVIQTEPAIPRQLSKTVREAGIDTDVAARLTGHDTRRGGTGDSVRVGSRLQDSGVVTSTTAHTIQHSADSFKWGTTQ